MRPYLAIRDKRLLGGVPARPNLGIVNLDEHTPLSRAFAAIRGYAGRGKIRVAYIFCHGFAGSNESTQQSMDVGGEGLLLGRELLRHNNVHLWRAVKGKIDEIVVYACAAADTQPAHVGTKADGRYLMRALALHTRATVYAADKIQWYHTHDGLKNGAYQFGRWEGRLFKFSPDGFTTTGVQKAPIEFTDILSGCYA